MRHYFGSIKGAEVVSLRGKRRSFNATNKDIALNWDAVISVASNAIKTRRYDYESYAACGDELFRFVLDFPRVFSKGFAAALHKFFSAV